MVKWNSQKEGPLQRALESFTRVVRALIVVCYFNFISFVFVCDEVTPNQLPVVISLFTILNNFHKQAMVFQCSTQV